VKDRHTNQTDQFPSSLLVRHLIQQYRASNEVEGKSPKTTEWYDQTLILFLEYLLANNLGTNLFIFTIDTARNYILYLKQRKKLSRYPGRKSLFLSPKTIQCHVRTLKAFSSWLFRENITQENRLMNLNVPKAPKKMIEPLTPPEMKKINRSFSKKNPLNSRDETVIDLMLDTGLRLSEVSFSDLTNLNLEKHYLKVLGKGGKERIVPFGDYVQGSLLHYIKKDRPHPANPSINNIFLTSDGRPLSTNALQLMFDRLKIASGVTRLHPHLCRHTFAINYLLNGGDVFTLKEILGHTTLDMVNHYLHFTSAQISIQHHKFSPMDKLKGKNSTQDEIKPSNRKTKLPKNRDRF
jgi:site-specific recombinase XerD